MPLSSDNLDRRGKQNKGLYDRWDCKGPHLLSHVLQPNPRLPVAQLFRRSDAPDWNASPGRRRMWHRRTAAVAAELSRYHRVPEPEDAALAPSPRQGPGHARWEDRYQHGMVGIHIELLACLRERLNRPRPLRMPKSTSINLAESEKQEPVSSVEPCHHRQSTDNPVARAPLQNRALLCAHQRCIPYGLQNPGIQVSGHARHFASWGFTPACILRKHGHA